MKRRMTTTEKGKEALINCLKERLKWLTFTAHQEESVVDEIIAIVNLLLILAPIEEPEYFNAEKGLERFWKYYDQRKQEEEYIEGIRQAEKEPPGSERLTFMAKQ